MRKNHKTLFVLLSFSCLIFLGNGCAGKSGRLTYDKNVTETFKSSQILKDHTYYYSGPEAKPHVIIGIKNSYTLRQDLWKKVDLTPQKLKDWISFMEIEDREYQPLPYGAKIIDIDGNQVGIWYSRQTKPTILRGKNNEIVIYTPNPRLDKKRVLTAPIRR